MALHRPHLTSIRLPGLPGRTVRSRLTWLYGSLFLISGIVVLVITGVLWNNATSGPGQAFAPVANQVFTITGIGGGGTAVNSGDQVGVTAVGGRHRLAPQTANKPGRAMAATLSPRAQRKQVVTRLKALTAEQHSSDLRDLLVYAGIAVAMMAVLALGLGWLTAGRVLRPIRTMTDRVRDISAHTLDERVGIEGPDDELTRLGNTFDELLGRLERSFQAQRLFAANASHELRTPLATMRAAIDVTLAKPEPPPPETARLAERLRGELDHVDRLLESLLALARAQTVDGGGGRQSLDDLVGSAVARHTGAIRQARLAVEREECASAQVAGDAALLARMVDNVVDNAVRHNQRGGWIRLSSEVDGDWAVLTVENGGAVLEQDGVAELVRPFRRRGPERTGSDAGFGLGLSIVDAIAAAHGGTLSIDARPDGGLRVRVELPRYEPDLAGALA